MDRSRRTFLAAGLLGSIGLAGCLSDDSGVEYPGGETPTTDVTSTSTTTTQTTPEETTTTTNTPTEGPNAALGAATDQILAEAEWFATEYDATVERYLTLCNQATATIEQIRQSSTFTENQSRKLQEATTRAATFTEANLRPHFDADGPVPGPFLDTIDTFAQRGDLDRVDAELEKLAKHFRAVGNGYYVRTEFSKDPIEDRLFDLLARPNDASVIFGIRLRNPGFTGWVYPHGESFERYRKVRFAASQPSFGSIFDPVAIPEERTGACSLTVNRIPNQVSWTQNSLPSIPVLIQSYPDTEKAAAAREIALDTAVTVEGTDSFGETNWDQVYYYHDGDIVYAYLVQAGPHLLTMSPSTTPWDERGESEQKSLTQSWLWEA